ncbi:MAG: hypothetical protein CVU74_08095 [Deltaproteobacteria bacterium HGW-Deltaproteobacteria-9]|nr:MAG: hypothetical protein CVU74_08095 [Deltaproteobacteria bacterium HGW-Deltaproteobacteria-9]
MFFYIEHFTTDMRFWDWAMANDISLFPCIVNTTWNEGINYAKGRETEAYHIDTTDLDSMIRSLASVNSRMAMNKQLRGPYDAPTQWRDDCLGIAKLMKPDFLVYTGTMGCRNSWGVNKLLQRDTERAGFPTLINFADAFDDRVVSWEAYRDKITEFMKVRGIGA